MQVVVHYIETKQFHKFGRERREKELHQVTKNILKNFRIVYPLSKNFSCYEGMVFYQILTKKIDKYIHHSPIHYYQLKVGMPNHIQVISLASKWDHLNFRDK